LTLLLLQSVLYSTRKHPTSSDFHQNTCTRFGIRFRPLHVIKLLLKIKTSISVFIKTDGPKLILLFNDWTFPPPFLSGFLYSIKKSAGFTTNPLPFSPEISPFIHLIYWYAFRLCGKLASNCCPSSRVDGNTFSHLKLLCWKSL